MSQSKKTAILKACRRKPRSGLTRREIEDSTGLRQCTVSGRVNDLIHAHQLETHGTRYCPRAQRQVNVVRVVA